MGATQLPMTTIAMAMGFNVRVGMEDNVLYRRGERWTNNAQLVERAVRIARELDRPIATPDAGARAARAARPRDGALPVRGEPRGCGHEAAALRLRRADRRSTRRSSCWPPTAPACWPAARASCRCMSARREHPAALVDINRLAGARRRCESNGDVVAGAIVRADRLARDPAVRAALPVLADAAARVGHPAVRNRGTVGGNLAFADPGQQPAGRRASPLTRS